MTIRESSLISYNNKLIQASGLVVNEMLHPCISIQLQRRWSQSSWVSIEMGNRQLHRLTPLGNLSAGGTMSAGDGRGHREGRNSEF